MRLSELFTIGCIIAGVAGIGCIAVGSWRLARSRRGERCPVCGYSFQGILTRVCPECGPTARVNKRAFVALVALGLLLTALLPAWLLWPRPIKRLWWVVRYPEWTPTSTARFGEIEIRHFAGGRPDNWMRSRYLALYRGRVFREGLERLTWDANRSSSPKSTSDIDGDGAPEAIFYESSGGAHCCYTAFVYQLSDPPILMGELDGLHTRPEFRDLDGDGIAEVEMIDWTWSYFYSFVEAPIVHVVLRWRGGQFGVVAELMRTEPPGTHELQSMASGVARIQASHSVPPLLLSYMLQLMYGGHERAAWELFDRVYPTPTAEQLSWAHEVRESLKASPYWSELKKAWSQP